MRVKYTPQLVPECVDWDNKAIDFNLPTTEKRFKKLMTKFFRWNDGSNNKKELMENQWPMIYDALIGKRKNHMFKLVQLGGYANDVMGRDDESFTLYLGIPKLKSRKLFKLAKIYVQLSVNNGSLYFYNSLIDDDNPETMPRYNSSSKIFADHPHVRSGQPCLGAYSTRIQRFKAQGDALGLFNVFTQYVNTWNVRSPYWLLNRVQMLWDTIPRHSVRNAILARGYEGQEYDDAEKFFDTYASVVQCDNNNYRANILIDAFAAIREIKSRAKMIAMKSKEIKQMAITSADISALLNRRTELNNITNMKFYYPGFIEPLRSGKSDYKASIYNEHHNIIARELRNNARHQRYKKQCKALQPIFALIENMFKQNSVINKIVDKPNNKYITRYIKKIVSIDNEIRELDNMVNAKYNNQFNVLFTHKRRDLVSKLKTIDSHLFGELARCRLNKRTEIARYINYFVTQFEAKIQKINYIKIINDIIKEYFTPVYLEDSNLVIRGNNFWTNLDLRYRARVNDYKRGFTIPTSFDELMKTTITAHNNKIAIESEIVCNELNKIIRRYYSYAAKQNTTSVHDQKSVRQVQLFTD